MATITSAQSGLASSPSTWVGGIVPVDGDKVIVAQGHTVEIDGTYTWGNDSGYSDTAGTGSIDVYGTLRASRTISSELIVRGWIQVQPSTGGRIDYGTPADRIPLGVTATLTLNRTATAFRTGIGMPSLFNQTAHSWQITFCGSGTRTRNAVLAEAVAAGATQIRLTTSNCGWQPGDSIRLPTSMDNVPGDRSSSATVASVSGDVVTLTAGLTNDHKAGCRACNLTSNVLVRPFTAGGTQTSRLFLRQHIGSSLPRKLIIDDAELRELGNSTNHTALSYEGQAPVADAPEVRRCVYNHATQPMVYNSPAGLISEDNVYLNLPWGFGTGRVLDTGSTFFRLTSSFSYGSLVRGAWLTHTGGTGNAANAGTYEDCTFSGQLQYISQPGTAPLVFRRCDIGQTHGYKAQFGADYFIRIGGTQGIIGSIVVEDCLLRGETATFETPNELVLQADIDLRYVNKQRDPTQQERHTQHGSMIRDNAMRFAGASSIRITPHNFAINLGRVFTHEQSVLCAAGQTVKLVVYVRATSAFYNSGDWTPPSVKVTGLGQSITLNATAACVNAWERFEIDATNLTAFDGSFTLSYNVALKTLSGGNVWFDGTPDGLFISRVRHYGYLFEETRAARRIDPVVIADRSAAEAYTGITINGSARTLAVSAARTWREVYDYHHAWACGDIEQPALLSSNDGTVIQLAADTVILWDQAPDNATLAGGTLAINPGTHSPALSGTSVRLLSGGSYNLGGASLSGVTKLYNPSGQACTVALPAGADYQEMDSGITVTQATASLTVTGAVPGSDVVVYDPVGAPGSNVLATGDEVPGNFSWVYEGARTVDIGVFKGGYVPLVIRGVELPAGGLSYRVTQQPDRNYAA